MSNPNNFRLPTDTAIAYTAKWRELQALNPTDPRGKVRAFTVHMSELKAIIDELDVKTVRFYLGINSSNTETLVLVGVNDDNEDMIHYKCKEEDGTLVDKAGTYDFTYPCPDTCAAGTSPLNQD
ncbi:hypothetical protein [Pedobacter sp. L105]|uniref:hypothetical protein n=1 Tax=Pedobacter sp. L105 TaxID=1641871 RepID=UPI00131BA5AD|nr:hypothetical protein [Pedobacter sp. L105]